MHAPLSSPLDRASEVSGAQAASSPSSHPSRRWNPARLSLASDNEQVVECFAGSYANEKDAFEALCELQSGPGVASPQLNLLSPRDARWWRFTRHAREWARRSAKTVGHDRTAEFWPLAALCASGAAIAVSAWWLLNQNADLGPFGMVGLWLGLSGMAAGVVATIKAHRASPHRRFNRALRRQLAAGRWAVVVHDVPWPQQWAAMMMVRRGSLQWCAVTAPQALL